MRQNYWSENQYTDEDVADALREAFGYAQYNGIEYLSHALYRKLHRAGLVTGPNPSRLIQRYKTWNNVCRMAGVPHGEAPENRVYTSKWDDVELLDWVARGIAEFGDDCTYKEFEAWLASQSADGAPSAMTIRNRFYPLGWNAIKKQVIMA